MANYIHFFCQNILEFIQMKDRGKEQVILLVEDNPDDEMLTLRALEKNKIMNKVIVARDGAEAVDFLHVSGLPGFNSDILPQIILLDLKLPKIDGLEVLKRIRENDRTKLIPVIILTSSKEEKDLIECYLNGANSYIRKPVDFIEFTQAVQQVGIYWLLLNELPSVV